jgi:hypothetical protein
MIFADDFGSTGEYFFDEPAEKFYRNRNQLTPEGRQATQILGRFLKTHQKCLIVAPLPENYRRLQYIKASVESAGITIATPQVAAPFIGYMKRGTDGARAFLERTISESHEP